MKVIRLRLRMALKIKSKVFVKIVCYYLIFLDDQKMIKYVNMNVCIFLLVSRILAF